MFNDENTNGYYDNQENPDNDHNNTDNKEQNNYSQGSNQNDYYQNSNQNDYYQNSNQNNYYQNDYNYNSNQNDYNQEPDKKKNKNKSALIITVVVVAALVMIIGLVATVSIVNKDIENPLNNIISENTDNSSKEETETKYEEIGSTDTANISSTSTGSVVVTDVSSVVEEAMPSVVAITSTTLVESNSYVDDIWGYYFGGRGEGSQQYEEEGAGSGIIIDQTDTELLIVTNNHVVEGTDSLKIQFYGEDENSNIDAYTKGTDANADVAVVAVKLEDIPSETLKNIKKATIGESDNVKVGEGVIAIGNALGYGQSVTTGVISARDREVTIDEKTMTLLQTDAAINGGNSGGALLNSKGEVIGINVAKYSSSGSATSASIEGMGFAIPISSVKEIISNLETRETRLKLNAEEQGYLGIHGNDVTDEVSDQYGVPKGAYVYSVTPGSAADKAGLVGSDVIVEFDGQTITSMSSLQSIMQYYKAGETVKMTIAYRSGRTYEQKEVTITLDDQETINSLNKADVQE